MEEIGRKTNETIIREYYNLRKSDSEKITEKIISFIENECLEWNHISCEWEVK